MHSSCLQDDYLAFLCYCLSEFPQRSLFSYAPPTLRRVFASRSELTARPDCGCKIRDFNTFKPNVFEYFLRIFLHFLNVTLIFCALHFYASAYFCVPNRGFRTETYQQIVISRLFRARNSVRRSQFHEFKMT